MGRPRPEIFALRAFLFQFYLFGILPETPPRPEKDVLPPPGELPLYFSQGRIRPLLLMGFFLFCSYHERRVE